MIGILGNVLAGAASVIERNHRAGILRDSLGGVTQEKAEQERTLRGGFTSAQLMQTIADMGDLPLAGWYAGRAGEEEGSWNAIPDAVPDVYDN